MSIPRPAVAWPPMDGVTAAMFRDRAGERFRVEELGLEWTLTEVDDHGTGSFALLFEGPVEPIVAQGTYTFRSVDEQTMAIFVVPVGPGANGRPLYEAVFNSSPSA